MSKNFADLQQEWYDKLKEDGFDDIEYFDNENDRLEPRDWIRDGFNKVWEGIVDHPDAKLDEQTFEYYSIIRTLSHTEDFDKEVDRKIFRMYGDGETYRKIAAEVKISHMSVGRCIKKYLKRFAVTNRQK